MDRPLLPFARRMNRGRPTVGRKHGDTGWRAGMPSVVTGFMLRDALPHGNLGPSHARYATIHFIDRHRRLIPLWKAASLDGCQH